MSKECDSIFKENMTGRNSNHFTLHSQHSAPSDPHSTMMTRLRPNAGSNSSKRGEARPAERRLCQLLSLGSLPEPRWAKYSQSQSHIAFCIAIRPGIWSEASWNPLTDWKQQWQSNWLCKTWIINRWAKFKLRDCRNSALQFPPLP